MTYQEREFLVSESSQPQQSYSQRRIFNKRNNIWYPSSRLSSSKPFRIECKAEERHFIGDTPSYYNIDSSLKPIRFTMNDQLEPAQFRSEIIVHNDAETDLHVKRLRVAFHFYDDSPTNAMLKSRATPPPESSIRSRSLDRPRSSVPQQQQQQQQQQKDNDSKRKFQSTTSSEFKFLHKWIDDICSNESLMTNDDIVFFIKNGEFFARI
ncbi:unnamed protein product [Rotaria sordida]|uniref:Uncharacterized protein n=1 Tax=Rotaria sordida TaxID=392033 RepID=A0A814ZAM6_9BILA|nr:unnamed protein product [Rotaria sordida]CAF1241270.1 unnamed protein product [Rotaria sordida]CAF3723497.1 unnamed protein product [Rotaria sordida]CAF3780652.1 unnamed protein product [Rotaria sordida]